MLSILINLAEKKLHLYQNQQRTSSYIIAIGKPSTPTPPGTYTIINKIVNPHLAALGTRWLGLSKPNYGIHGTNKPASIGTMASLGCIRMHNRDVEEIFPLVPIGTVVEIISGISNYNPNPALAPKPTPPPYYQPIPNPQQTPYQRHIVQRGDSLWNISQKFGIPLDVLIKANKLNNPNMIYPGQELIIPKNNL